MKGRVLIGLVILAVVALTLRLTLFAERRVDVETAPAEPGPVEDVVTNSESGTVRSRGEAQLAVEQGGRVTELRVREGDAVRTGELLLALDPGTEAARLEAARRDLQAAAAAQEAARAALDLAQLTYDRTVELHRRGLVAQERLDDARSRLEVARADRRLAGARHESARAAVRLAEDALGHVEIRAPFDGVVARRLVEPGETVTPGVPLLELVDPRRLYVRCPIDERDAGRLAVGLPARVTVDTYPGVVWAGRLAWVAPRVEEAREQNRTLDVEVDLPPDSTRPVPRPGMTADLEVVLAARQAAVRVPSDAVLDGRRVYVVERGRAVSRDVTLGLRNWDWSEVTSGLAAGATVITTLDRSGLAPGVRVSARPAPPRAGGD